MRQDNNHDKLNGKVARLILLVTQVERMADGALKKERRADSSRDIARRKDWKYKKHRSIENFKADTLKYAIKDMIQPTASIRTDDYCSYSTIQRQGMNNIRTGTAPKLESFEETHRCAMQFKNWLAEYIIAGQRSTGLPTSMNMSLGSTAEML